MFEFWLIYLDYLLNYFRANRPKSYISRTIGWDQYPHGRWGDSRNASYGTLADYQACTFFFSFFFYRKRKILLKHGGIRHVLLFKISTLLTLSWAKYKFLFLFFSFCTVAASIALLSGHCYNVIAQKYSKTINLTKRKLISSQTANHVISRVLAQLRKCMC